MPLPVPSLPTEVPGNYMTSALQNTLGVSGLGFALAVPVGYLYQGTTQSIANATNVAITCDSTSYDPYNGHSNVTNNTRYTAQQPGYYAVYGVACYANNTTGRRVATVGKNGSIATQPGAFGIFPALSGTDLSCAQCFGLVQMNGTTDYVEIYANQGSGSTISTAVASSASQQSMMLVWWLHS